MTTEIAMKSRGDRIVRKGSVVSRSGDKSVVVRIERRKRHPLYGKVIRIFKKVHVHDADNAASVGDKVRIVECRPVSSLKRWRILSVLSDTQAAVRKAGAE